MRSYHLPTPECQICVNEANAKAKGKSIAEGEESTVLADSFQQHTIQCETTSCPPLALCLDAYYLTTIPSTRAYAFHQTLLWGISKVLSTLHHTRLHYTRSIDHSRSMLSGQHKRTASSFKRHLLSIAHRQFTLNYLPLPYPCPAPCSSLSSFFSTPQSYSFPPGVYAVLSLFIFSRIALSLSFGGRAAFTCFCCFCCCKLSFALVFRSAFAPTYPNPLPPFISWIT